MGGLHRAFARGAYTRDVTTLEAPPLDVPRTTALSLPRSRGRVRTSALVALKLAAGAVVSAGIGALMSPVA